MKELFSSMWNMPTENLLQAVTVGALIFFGSMIVVLFVFLFLVGPRMLRAWKSEKVKTKKDGADRRMELERKEFKALLRRPVSPSNNLTIQAGMITPDKIAANHIEGLMEEETRLFPWLQDRIRRKAGR